MNTYFKVLLEEPTASAAIKYLEHSAYVRGEYSSTERGKRKDKEKHEPLKEEARLRLVELLKLNFPEFIDRFHHVSHHVNKESVYVAVDRLIPQESETEVTDPFAG